MKRRSKGFTLIEVSVTLLLVSLVMIIFYELLEGSLKASMFVESRNDLIVVGQRVVNELQTDILQCRLMYEEGAIADAYIALFGTTPNLLAGSKLPKVDTAGTLDPDTGSDDFVGNRLLIVKNLEPVGIPYDTCCAGAGADQPDGVLDPTVDADFAANIYRYQYYYLGTNNARSFDATGSYVELYERKSQSFADYFQLSEAFTAMSLTAFQIQNIAGGLLALSPSVNTAWDPGKDAPNAFYTFNGNGVFTGPVVLTFQVSQRSMMPEFRGGRISGKMEYSVGLNAYTSQLNPVPYFANPSLVAGAFPSGLEFKVVGESNKRQVWARLVLLSQHLDSIDSRSNIVITKTSEF